MITVSTSLTASLNSEICGMESVVHESTSYNSIYIQKKFQIFHDEKAS
jgi:hypothetical protein